MAVQFTRYDDMTEEERAELLKKEPAAAKFIRPLLDAQEIEVPGSMPRVIRVLLHVESALPRERIEHVYLGRAAALRPDLKDRA